MLTVVVLVVVACYAALAGSCLWLLRQLRQQEQREAEHVARLEQLIKRLDSRFEVHRANGIRMGEQLRELREQRDLRELPKIVKLLSERVARLEQSDSGSHSFTQAARLASMGATPDELTRTFGLTQAEAELMSRVQQSRGSAN